MGRGLSDRFWFEKHCSRHMKWFVSGSRIHWVSFTLRRKLTSIAPSTSRNLLSKQISGAPTCSSNPFADTGKTIPTKRIFDFITFHRTKCSATWGMAKNPGRRSRGITPVLPTPLRRLCDLLQSLSPLSEDDGFSNYSDLIALVEDRPGHDRRYAIDVSKIERELGWEPAESFESGMKKRCSGTWRIALGGKRFSRGVTDWADSAMLELN